METTTERFKFSQVPTAAPGECLICRVPQCDLGYLSPDLVSVDLYGDPNFPDYLGAVAFCGECIAQMARQYGWMLPGEAANLTLRVDTAERKIVEQTSLILTLEQALGSLTDLNVLLGRDSNTSVDSESDFIEETDQASGVIDSSTVEPVISERSDDSTGYGSDPFAEFDSTGIQFRLCNR